jgi:eukaryotic-like serine/threonine-protein kinase
MIQCPHCRHQIEVKGARPGRFTPKCTKCGQRFMLVIPEGGGDPQVSVIAPNSAAATQPPQQTAAPAAAPRRAEPTETQPPTAAPQRPAPRSTPAPVEQTEDLIGADLGGYHVKEKLGQGGMGAVYLARQVSLDRDVAVKVMNPSWAKDPQFVSRFTREAYAAAQLTHHHVVQIHDIGAQDDLHFFSMEFVRGRNLGAVLAQQGKLDPEAAAGYVLQAARGLKFAHDQKMIHRDIKPENLLLNDQGIVKVADLGLVKTPGDRSTVSAGEGSRLSEAAAGSQTQLNMSMGTPAYMAPEQARNAAQADARSDIYSLGCTLYALVTGQPPFTGRTAVEVLTKHESQPMPAPEIINKRVPGTLSAIIQKMTAKEPWDRYQTMGDVIKALEGFLGVESSGPFSPREEHATALEGSVKQFNSSPQAALRRNLIRAFFGVCAVALIATVLMDHWAVAGGIVGLAVLTFLSYIVVTGLTEKTFVFRKLRELVFGSRIVDWLKWIALLAIVTAALYFVGMLWIWLGVCLLAAILAAGFHFSIDRMVAAQRQAPVTETQQLLRTMRLRGLEENSLRQFVCKYAGPRWEEFYEALFGYEAKIQARELWGRGEQGKMRRKHAAWRDGVIAWVDRTQRVRRAARDRQLLERLQEKSLAASGMAATEAKKKAQDETNQVLSRAAEVKASVIMRAAMTAGPESSGSSRARSMMMQDMAADSENPKAKREQDRVEASKVFGGAVGLLLLGPRARFVVGAVLVAICVIWANQNNLINAKEWRTLASNVMENAYNDAANPDEKHLKTDIPKTPAIPTKTVSLPMLPEGIAHDYLSSPIVGFAGLLLLLSALRPGAKTGLFMFPAAAVMIVGPSVGVNMLHLHPYGILNAGMISVAAGLFIAAIGYVFGAERS